MMVALAGNQQDFGNVRETFFMNQIIEKYPVSSAKETDFLVAEKYYSELGGKSKSKKQIRQFENAFVVKDGIEIGSGNIIPLWLFGLLS